MNLLKIGWAEFLIALLLGAPVRLRSGKVLRIPYPQKSQRILDPLLFGFDFSKWQDVVDFARVLAYGAKFVILRCSYALTRDEKFLVFIEDCLANFADVTSVYHYYDPVVSPTRQADKVIEILAPYKGRIKRVWGDFEFYWSGAYESSANWKIFAERIIAAGYEFGVYTRKTWWDSRVGNLASWFGQFPLWAAQYSSALTYIPAGWTKADLWQSGTPPIGTDVGAGSLEVDYNIADSEFYKKEYGAAIPPVGGEMAKYEVIVGGLNLRTAPIVDTTTLILSMTKGTQVWGVLESSGWIKVTHYQLPGEPYAVLQDGYCSGNALYVKAVDFTEPPLPGVSKNITVTIELEGYKPWTITGVLEQA